MHSLILLLLSSLATAAQQDAAQIPLEIAAQQHATPPAYGTDCELQLVGTPQTRIASGNAKVGNCVRVGEVCASEADCHSPSLEDCRAADAGRHKNYFRQGGRCIDGYCRYDHADDGDTCDCLIGCYFKKIGSPNDQSCIKGICTPGPCAPCDEAPGNRVCCGSGVVGHNGKCYCPSGVGEGCGTNPAQCSGENFNDMCCGKGTENEGKCCSEDSCNGQCLHRPTT